MANKFRFALAGQKKQARVCGPPASKVAEPNLEQLLKHELDRVVVRDDRLAEAENERLESPYGVNRGTDQDEQHGTPFRGESEGYESRRAAGVRAGLFGASYTPSCDKPATNGGGPEALSTPVQTSGGSVPTAVRYLTFHSS